MAEVVVRLVDLRGMCPPTNFVKARVALELAENGDIFRFYLDEKESEQGFARGLTADGHRLLDSRKSDGFFVLTVEKVRAEF